MDQSTLHRMRVLIYIALSLWVVVIIYALLRAPAPALGMIVRAAALFGYTALFLGILSSEYLRQMRKLFGKPFLAVHHSLAVIGLVLIIIHPLAFALQSNSLSVFLPVFSPFRIFLALAGRPALYLFLIAALAALVRGRLKATWKFIHWLNYLAFVLASIHAWLIGTDTATGLLRVACVIMAGVVLVVFVHKRLLSR